MDTERMSKKRRMVNSSEQHDDMDTLIDLGWPKQGMGSRAADETPRRPLQTALLLPQGVLIHCPPLSPIRPQPSLLACLIPTTTSSESFKPRTAEPTRSYPLPMPAPLSLVPYTYGRPTLLSRSHDASHFLVFWPRLSDALTSELSQLSSVAATTWKTTATPNPAFASNFSQDESYTLDQGGVLALYTKPAPSIRRTTYYHTYDIYSYWTTAYNPVTSLWLFEPRRWEVRSTRRRDRLKVELDTDEMHVEVNGRADDHTNGNLPNGLPNGHTEEDPDHAQVEFVRTPFRGPRSATTSQTGTSTTIGFVVLFADHHLNFYSTEKSIPPVNLASETYGEASPSPHYPALDVLRCPLLTPSTVMIETSPGHGENDPEAPVNAKSRLIVPGQARIHIRADDETIWVAFRSFRPRTIWTAAEDNRPDLGTVNGMMSQEPSIALEGGLAGMLDPSREVEGLNNRRVRRAPRSVFRGADREGQEEDWMDLVEVRLELREDVLSMSARPVPKLDLPDNEEILLCNSGYRLNGIVFADPLDEDMDDVANNEGAEPLAQSTTSDRPLSLLVVLSPGVSLDMTAHRRTKLVRYKVVKRNVVLSDAFANLGSPTLPTKKVDLSGAGRSEWIPELSQVETVPGNLRLLEGLARHRYRDIPVAVETDGDWLNPGDTRVVWMTIHGLKLGAEIFETATELAEAAFDHQCETIAWRVADSSRLRLAPLVNPTRSSYRRDDMEDMADVLCEAILNAEGSRCNVSRLIKADKEQRDMVDNVLLMVWRRLCSKTDGTSPGLGHVAGFIQIQHKIFSATGDERAGSALFMLECLRSLQMFTLAYRATLSRDAEGSEQKQHSYDSSAFWLLKGHVKWYLGVIRAILRGAILKSSGNDEGTDRASLLQFMINPVSLRILRDLHNHAQAFAICATRFKHPLPAHPALSQPGHVDLVSTDIIQMDLRQDLESAGVRLGVFTKIYDFCAEMAQIETPDLGLQDWSNALYLNYTLPNTADSLESRIIAHLTTDDKTIQHQALLFTHQSFIPIEAERLNTDIISKEAIPASTTLAQRQNRTLRQCAQCSHRTACWQLVLKSDGTMPQGVMPAISETDDSASRWLHQWQNVCICGGLWLPA